MTDIPELPPETSTPTEWSKVERPLLMQLAKMGWNIIIGDNDVPYLTKRGDFRQVILKPDLEEAIKKINTGITPIEIERAIIKLTAPQGRTLMEKNRQFHELLLKGVYITPETGTRQKNVKFMDFGTLENNSFNAINQFRVETDTGPAIIPDIMLFINGLPVGIIECKAADLPEPMEEAIDQMLRYSSQRHWVGEPEGREDLFVYNQVMVAASFYKALVGAVGAQEDEYQEWKDTTPRTPEEVAAELGKEGKIKAQEILAAGVLRPANLLDIIQNFIIFDHSEGRIKKVIPRYQQYRAVDKAVNKLLTFTGPAGSELIDRRGGVIGHTQGSGKSITMVYLIRKMRNLHELQPFKVVVVTDRTHLEGQLRDTAALTGGLIRPDDNDSRLGKSDTDVLLAILKQESPDVVFAMIQKYLVRDPDAEVLEYKLPEKVVGRDKLTEDERVMRQRLESPEPFPVLNKSGRILLLVDECHRTHTSVLHANLRQALPNAIIMGFSGTPIMNNEANDTRRIFGEILDSYPLQQAVEDKATVPIVYEGRTAEGAVESASQLDAKFEDMFKDKTDREIQAIKAKYATQDDVLEATKLIAAKARDMLLHYVTTVMPSGFKAQLVAVSRKAAVMYQAELLAARAELVAELEAVPAAIRALPAEELEKQPQRTQLLVRAHKHLALIKELEFAAVVSGVHNDPGPWRQWSDSAKRDANIARFKKPLFHKEPARRDALAFLCVKNMLLTGFDAPVEQVLYLDRTIKGHELLQAIARVNRRAANKSCGYVVDYVGITRHLDAALEGYKAGDIDGALVDITAELPLLRDRHQAVIDLFKANGIADIRDTEKCVDLLENKKIRAEFINKAKEFYLSLNIILPRPEALKYIRDAKIIGFIARVAAVVYREEALNLLGAERKVKALIDEYMTATGMAQKIAPIAITDAKFAEIVAALGSAKSRAKAMAHAARYHITTGMGEDPAYYRKLSERLEEILAEFKDNWVELEAALRKYIAEELLKGRTESVAGLDPKTHVPFYALLKEEAERTTGMIGEVSKIAAVTKEIVDKIKEAISAADFWTHPLQRQQLETALNRHLAMGELPVSTERRQELVTRLVDVAKRLHTKLVQ